MLLNHHYSLTAGIVLHGVYRIQRVLGAGAFGITYLAQHVNLGSLWVIKEYLPEFAIRQDQRVLPLNADKEQVFHWGLNGFFEEAKMLHRLNHPNIVKVVDLFEENSTAYFVMPYVGGHTFFDWISSRSTPNVDELVAIFVPILDGLSYIHAQGLLHRDIKPTNILLTIDHTPVLIDFGSARFSIGVSKPATQLLTPSFAPIEQYGTKSHLTAALDIYSVSACLYQAITGQLPETAPDRLHNDTQVKLAHHPSYRHLYPNYFLQALDKGLSVQPENRFQTALEMKNALLDLHATTAQHTLPINDPATTIIPPATKIHSPQTNQAVAEPKPPKKIKQIHVLSSRQPAKSSGSLKGLFGLLKWLLKLSVVASVAWWSYPKIKNWLPKSQPSSPVSKSDQPYRSTITLQINGKTATYTGWLKNGIAQDNTGTATLNFDDGTECTVSMLNNQRHGTGKCVYPKGSVYDGAWKNDLKHGYGKYLLPKSSSIKSYEGGFVNGKLSGKGVMKFKNGAVFIGEFANDDIKPNAQGEITGILGTAVKCVGTFSRSDADCAFQFENGLITKFKGKHKNGLWNGEGMVTNISDSQQLEQFRGRFVDGELLQKLDQPNAVVADETTADSSIDEPPEPPDRSSKFQQPLQHLF